MHSSHPHGLVSTSSQMFYLNIAFFIGNRKKYREFGKYRDFGSKEKISDHLFPIPDTFEIPYNAVPYAFSK